MALRWIVQFIVMIFLSAPMISVVFSTEIFKDALELNEDFDDDTTDSEEFEEFIKFVKHFNSSITHLLSSSNLVFPEIQSSILQNYHGDVSTPPPDVLLIE